MIQQTALGLIIAKALVLIDAIMECFVAASFNGVGEIQCNVANCGTATTIYSGTLTLCGEYVVSQLQVSLVALAGLAANVLPALGISA